MHELVQELHSLTANTANNYITSMGSESLNNHFSKFKNEKASNIDKTCEMLIQKFQNMCEKQQDIKILESQSQNQVNQSKKSNE